MLFGEVEEEETGAEERAAVGETGMPRLRTLTFLGFRKLRMKKAHREKGSAQGHTASQWMGTDHDPLLEPPTRLLSIAAQNPIS